MDQLSLGPEDWLDTPYKEARLETRITEDVDELLETADWQEGRYDDGWQRAGQESFYRIAEDEGEPAFIQKSGNPRKTIERGHRLEQEGAVVIPTVVTVPEDGLSYDGGEVTVSEDLLSKTGTISGSDYTIIQDYVPESFAQRYEDGAVTETAIEDLGRNAAALDAAGFRTRDPETQLKEMLCDGDHTYITDFGADIGTDGYEPRDDMYDGIIDELDPDDRTAFQTGYQTVRGMVPEDNP